MVRIWRKVILNIYNKHKTVEGVINDTMYESGPFIIEISSDKYIVYEKKTSVTETRGWMGCVHKSSDVKVDKVFKYVIFGNVDAVKI